MQVLNRRGFVKAAGAATTGMLLGPRMYALGVAQAEAAKPVAANDHIQIALIGAGGQGQGDTKARRAGSGREAGGRGGLLQRPPRAQQGTLGRRHLYHARLQRDSGAQGYRRRHHRHAGPLAQAGLGGRHEGRQGRLLREADDPSLCRRAGDDRDRALNQSHHPDRQPARQLGRFTPRPRNCSPPAPSASSTW